MRFNYLTFLILVFFLPQITGCSLIRNFRGEADISDPIEAQAEIDRMHALKINRAIAHQDLILGMGMQDVRSIWGEPRDVETAGDLRLGNQRWVYFNGLSSAWSMSSKRVVYFEAGQVVGWDSK